MKRSRITSLIAVPALIGVVLVPLLVAPPALGDAQTRNLTIHTLGYRARRASFRDRGACARISRRPRT